MCAPGYAPRVCATNQKMHHPASAGLKRARVGAGVSADVRAGASAGALVCHLALGRAGDILAAMIVAMPFRLVYPIDTLTAADASP